MLKSADVGTTGVSAAASDSNRVWRLCFTGYALAPFGSVMVDIGGGVGVLFLC